MEQKQVLYADNDREYLDTRSEFLEMEGYRVLKAYNPEEARRLLENENVHVAILDIRLENDDDAEDISGILLAKEERYKRIPKIFVTGFPTYSAVLEAYGSIISGEPVAYAFLAKKEGPQALIEAVNSLFEKVVGIDWDMCLVRGESGLLDFPNLTLLLESGIDPALLAARSSELKDLVRKLFSTYEQISMVKLNWLQSACVCLTVFALNENSSRQAITLLGNWDVVANQHNLSKQFPLKGGGLYEGQAFAETQHYAGISYEIPDRGAGPLLTGQEFFREAGDRTVRLAIENLFIQFLQKWRQNKPSVRAKVDLAAHFRKLLGIQIHAEALENARLITHTLARRAQTLSLLNCFSFTEFEIDFLFPNGQSFRGPHPISALFDPNSFGTQTVETSSTFGGISLRTLLFDQAGHVYPTDLSTRSESAVLDDFVSIESAFHFDSTPSLNLLTLLEFEKLIAQAQTLNDSLPPGNVEPECRKALTAIQAVRKTAAEVTGEDLEPFLIGLFHYALSPLLNYQPQLHLPKYQAAQYLHRIIAASVILMQIQELKEGQHSLSEKPADLSAGLVVNEASREVSLDAREVRLTPTEFKLLLYLYKHKNCLCTREEILFEVFAMKAPYTRNDKGLLNTHIDRLRKKIDLNTSRHRYIVTIRGEGYKLNLPA